MATTTPLINVANLQQLLDSLHHQKPSSSSTTTIASKSTTTTTSSPDTTPYRRVSRKIPKPIATHTPCSITQYDYQYHPLSLEPHPTRAVHDLNANISTVTTTTYCRWDMHEIDMSKNPFIFRIVTHYRFPYQGYNAPTPSTAATTANTAESCDFLPNKQFCSAACMMAFLLTEIKEPLRSLYIALTEKYLASLFPELLFPIQPACARDLLPIFSKTRYRTIDEYRTDQQQKNSGTCESSSSSCILLYPQNLVHEHSYSTNVSFGESMTVPPPTSAQNNNNNNQLDSIVTTTPTVSSTAAATSSAVTNTAINTIWNAVSSMPREAVMDLTSKSTTTTTNQTDVSTKLAESANATTVGKKRTRKSPTSGNEPKTKKSKTTPPPPALANLSQFHLLKQMHEQQQQQKQQLNQ